MAREKSKSELEAEIELRNALEKERKISDDKYAIKLAETLIFGLVGLLAITVIGAVLKVILK